jgi:transaldolase
LLVASLRSADQLVKLARAGLDAFTVSEAIAAELLAEELTRAAAGEFERAAERAGRGSATAP